MEAFPSLGQLGSGAGHGAALGAVGLGADVGHFGRLALGVVVVDFVLEEEDEDEDEDGGHDDAPDDDDHGPAEELSVEGAALLVLLLGGELHAPEGPGRRQGCGPIVVDGEDAEVVLASCNQISQEEGFTGGWDHPGREKERDQLPGWREPKGCKETAQEKDGRPGYWQGEWLSGSVAWHKGCDGVAAVRRAPGLGAWMGKKEKGWHR